MIITGEHARRFLTGVMNIRTAIILTAPRPRFINGIFKRSCDRFAGIGGDGRLSCSSIAIHRTRRRRAEVSHKVNIQLRWLPKVCSELNVMDHLRQDVKDLTAVNEPTPSVHATVDRARREIRHMSPRERLQKAEVLS